GASIRYTTDGSEPSSVAGTVYAVPVSVTATTTLKAIAYKSNMLDSAVTSKTYTMKTAAPVFTPAAGTYDGPKTISMSCATAGAVIYYTTNGDTPTVSSAQYGAPFAIDSTQTIKAFAQKAGLADSAVSTALYTISVPAPVITPASGTYQSAQNVTITCAMPGASIHYTVDGSNPTAASAQYTSPINVAVTTTVKAIAVKAGAQTSGIASAVYTIGVPVATPVFTPQGGSYNASQTVTISCATAGATIYYTTNGSDPTTASAQYTVPLNVSTTTTIKAMAAKAAMVNSQIATAVYNITLQQVAAPVFTPAAGAYISAQSVAISCATAGADIYYTTDGSNPTTASGKYSSPFNVAANTTVKAFAVKAGMTDSPVASAVYTISTVGKVVNVNYNSTTKNVSWDPVSVPGADSVKYYYKGTATITGMGSQAIPEGSTTETSLNAPGLVPDSVNVPGIGVISLIGKTIDVTLTIQAAAIKNTTEVRGAISDPCSFTFVK
ncbi:MAG TPA: chitobiase/beta-hexosaminidase C-terminal domain-containing protein, partial [Candidatus Wallbacteria bacterium]|nr:chitobiase/beta-hexosaminidase C-terminal domain-containing protein [Candidatus Wallbacteria bacterium]